MTGWLLPLVAGRHQGHSLMFWPISCSAVFSMRLSFSDSWWCSLFSTIRHGVRISDVTGSRKGEERKTLVTRFLSFVKENNCFLIIPSNRLPLTSAWSAQGLVTPYWLKGCLYDAYGGMWLSHLVPRFHLERKGRFLDHKQEAPAVRSDIISLGLQRWLWQLSTMTIGVMGFGVKWRNREKTRG